MNNGLVYTAVSRNNGLIIFDALAASELQTGRRLYEDVTDFSNGLQRYNYCTRYAIKDRRMLVAALKAVEVECRAGVLLPILHFECHGDAEKGLYIAPSGEYVPWQDLVDYVASINASTRNNTSVVLASCHGYEISKLVAIGKPCPFHFVIGPTAEVDAGRLRDTLIAFYRVVMKTGDLAGAIQELDTGYKHFVCGEWFYSTFATYMARYFTAKNRSEMVEDMVSSNVAKAGYSNRELIRSSRKKAQQYLRTPQTLFRRLSSQFLHNQLGVTYADFEAFVKASKD